MSNTKWQGPARIADKVAHVVSTEHIAFYIITVMRHKSLIINDYLFREIDSCQIFDDPNPNAGTNE